MLNTITSLRSGLVNQILLNLVAALAPSLNDLVKKFNLDLTKIKKDDLIILLLIQNSQILENQAKIISDLHNLLLKVYENTTILKARTERH